MKTDTPPQYTLRPTLGYFAPQHPPQLPPRPNDSYAPPPERAILLLLRLDNTNNHHLKSHILLFNNINNHLPTGTILLSSRPISITRLEL